VEQAVKWHKTESIKTGSDYKQIQSDARRGNFHLFAHRYGLANALWEAEEEDSVKEALFIGQKLLDIATEVYPKSEDTTRDIKDFVLDLSLEVGQWDDAAALLARFNDDITEESLWAAVLIYFKSRGPDSKATRKALERATRINPHVFSLLVGERLLADGEVERCRAEGASHFFLNGQWVGAPNNAPVYFHNYAKYFVQEPTLIEWMKVQKSTLKPILGNKAALDQSIEGMFTDIADGNAGVKEKGVQSTLSKVVKTKVCCANCGKIGGLLLCSRCQEVSYCDRQCQLGHWKDHKAFCHKHAVRKRDNKESDIGPQDDKNQAKEELGHSSWARLNVETRRNLIKFHREGNWKPWPVTAETPAMLNHPSYSFLTAHPDMKFRALVQAPPHSFKTSYDDPTESNVHGKIFQPGQAPFLLLREIVSPPGPTNKVPLHNFGTSTEFLLVAEVRYTNMCEMALKDFYSHKNKGRMFDWPGIDAIETCPGTGERIPTHSKELRLLAAFQMHGYFISGGSLHKLTRVIPRILTMNGLNRLFGCTPPGSPNRVACYTGTGGCPGCDDMQDIYPDLLRRFAGQKPRKEPRKPPTANNAWEAFHEDGRYCAYERFVDNHEDGKSKSYKI